MAYIGSWKIDDLLTFSCNTHRVDTGAATDADSVPSYRVYEDETGTAILNGSMAKLDDTNTTGFYSEQITLSAANGFEKGKCYTVYISATVNSVVGTTERHFQIGAEVDVRHAAGTAWASGAITAAVIATGAIDADAIADNAIDAGAIASDAITAAKIANGAIDAATFAADVDAEILSYLVDDATRIDASALNTLSGHDPGETIMGATDTVVLTDGSLTAAKIAADAITAAKLAADVTTELQSGLATTTHVQEVEDKVDILDTNVDTLLARITSTLFAGITSLAEWLGLMAGKQTGNNTARTEIRATGAGSGTYTETTDSLEAVRDRGDAAWTTATGFSTHSASDVWAAGTRSLTVIDEDSTTLDLDATIRAAVGLAAANLDTQLTAIDDAVDTEVGAIKTVTDKLDDTLEDQGGGTYGFTAAALQEAPGGGSAPTAGEIADAVWDEATAGHTTSGTFGEQLKTDVDAILADTDVIGTPSNLGGGATVAANLSDIEAHTDDIGSSGAGLSAIPWNAAWDAEVQSEVADALGVYDPPTKAELDSAVAPLALEASVQTVDGNVDAILADTGTDGVVVAAASKTGYRLSSAGVDDVLDELIGDSTITMRQALKLAVATLAGKLSGAGTTEVTIRNAADDTDVVVATVTAEGNRTAVTLSL